MFMAAVRSVECVQSTEGRSMAQFANPFPGLIPNQKLTRDETVRFLRQDFAAEQEAAHLYEALRDATDNELVKISIQEIANDEKVHAGKFMRMIEALTGDEGKYLLQGVYEVNKEYETLTNSQANHSVNPNFNVVDSFGIEEDDIRKIAHKVASSILERK
jgi:uncharacterized protein